MTSIEHAVAQALKASGGDPNEALALLMDQWDDDTDPEVQAEVTEMAVRLVMENTAQQVIDEGKITDAKAIAEEVIKRMGRSHLRLIT